MLSPDGKVAEQGTYRELAARPDGAFTKLMEWQMTGGTDAAATEENSASRPRGPPTEDEVLRESLTGPSQPGETADEGLREHKEAETVPEAVLEKTGEQTR